MTQEELRSNIFNNPGAINGNPSSPVQFSHISAYIYPDLVALIAAINGISPSVPTISFQNSNMAAPVTCYAWYDGLTLVRLYEPIKDNDISGPAINTFPFDTAGSGNRYTNVTLTWDNGSTLEKLTASNCTIDIGSVGACAISGGNIGSGATVILMDTHILTDCTIGPGKTVDLTTVPAGYTATGKVYVGNKSTFECDVEIDVSGADFIRTNDIGGVDYSFCGIFTKIRNTGTVVTLNSINASTDHDLIFVAYNLAADIKWVVASPTATYPFYLSGGQDVTFTQEGHRIGLSYMASDNITAGFSQNGDTLIY